MVQVADKPKAEMPKPDAKDDVKSLPLPEVEKKLEASPDGLSQDEAKKRLTQYGENSVTVEKPHPIREFLGKFWGPIPWMLKRL